MNNYLLLGACFLLGILLRRLGRLPDNAAASLNGFVVHISLPALTLTYVHGLKLDSSLILPALMAWVMFGLGCGFFWLAGRALGFSRATTGGLMLTGGLANTSFIGLPMIDTFYGPQFLGLGILIDQLGSYFVLSTLGILVASLSSSGHSINAKTVIRKIVLFAPFQAFVLALLLMPFEYPIWLDDLLKRLAKVLPHTAKSPALRPHRRELRQDWVLCFSNALGRSFTRHFVAARVPQTRLSMRALGVVDAQGAVPVNLTPPDRDRSYLSAHKQPGAPTRCPRRPPARCPA